MVAMTSEQRDRVRQSWLNRNASTTSENQECSICLDEKSKADFVTLSCQHSYCQVCVEYLVDQAIREKNTNQLKCPNQECARTISQEDIRSITNDQAKIDAIAEIRTRELLAKESETKQCPTPDCSYAFLSPKNVKQSITCPQCDKQYCSACLIKHTQDVTCEQADKNKTEERQSEEWKKINARQCPQCSKVIYRDGGCPSMQCPCGHGFCWNCLGPYYHRAHTCSFVATQPNPEPRVYLVAEQINRDPNIIIRPRIILHEPANRQQLNTYTNDILRLYPNGMSPADNIRFGRLYMRTLIEFDNATNEAWNAFKTFIVRHPYWRRYAQRMNELQPRYDQFELYSHMSREDIQEMVNAFNVQ